MNQNLTQIIKLGYKHRQMKLVDTICNFGISNFIAFTQPIKCPFDFLYAIKPKNPI